MAPRLARSQLSTFTYFHICIRGNNAEVVFLDDSDRLLFLSICEKYRKKFNLACFAYCLMTNHIHILLRAPSIKKLSKAMQAINVSYAMRFNRKYGRKGHLFQNRFSSWVITEEKHVLETKQYIENNPVRTGLAETATNYVWSSATGGDSSLLTLFQLMI